ncbi:hypothetical protein ACJBS1_04870, partial [Streptococcus suis]
ALAATSIAGGFLVFLYEKNWLEAIIKTLWTHNLIHNVLFIIIHFVELLLLRLGFLHLFISKRVE